MDLRRPIPERNSRSVLVGMTGSGKTTLAKALVQWYPFVVVYDVKGMMKASEWPGFELVKEFDKLIRTDSRKVIYQPIYAELPQKDWSICEKFFEWIYMRKNTCLMVDEVYGCTAKQEMPDYYKAILTRGRERGITLLSCTQRPAMIPSFILSESENYYVFRLQLPQDRKRIEEIKGFPVAEQKALEKYEFLIANAEDMSLTPRRLTI